MNNLKLLVDIIDYLKWFSQEVSKKEREKVENLESRCLWKIKNLEGRYRWKILYLDIIFGYYILEIKVWLI